VWIEKQDAAGVVVDRKVEATSSVDVLAKVQFHWEKYHEKNIIYCISCDFISHSGLR
jgi:hypothetical protein